MAKNPVPEIRAKLADFPGEMMLYTSDAASYLDVSVEQLARMRTDGIGPDWTADPKARADKVFYLKEDLDAWLASNRTGLPVGKVSGKK